MIGTVDIHSHILHGVDDGADDLNEALEMLRLAARNGTTDICLTPHYLANENRCSGLSASELKECFERFKESVSRTVPEINIHLGAEVYSAGTIESVMRNGEIISLSDSGYVLTEFDFNDSPKRAMEIVRILQSGGYGVVIAHPERYVFIQENPRLIVPFLERGALLQINAQSILGVCGPVAQDVALSFLENALATAVASDAHSAYYRTPDLSEAYSFVSLHFSNDYAERLFSRNPTAIIRGEKISIL